MVVGLAGGGADDELVGLAVADGGGSEGVVDGVVEGDSDGELEGLVDGEVDGLVGGEVDGLVDGFVDVEGLAEDDGFDEDDGFADGLRFGAGFVEAGEVEPPGLSGADRGAAGCAARASGEACFTFGR